ncbi:MAG: helix-turn-helix transcriptional regulator [Psychromonas sp.]
MIMQPSPYLSLIENKQFLTILETIKAMHGDVYDLLESAQVPDQLFDFGEDSYLLTSRVVAFFQLLEQRVDNATLIKIVQISAQKNVLQLIQQLPINNDITLQQALQLFFDYNFRSSPQSNFFIKTLFNRQFLCRETLFINEKAMPVMELYLIALLEALVSALCKINHRCQSILLQSEKFKLCQQLSQNKQLTIYTEQQYTAIELSEADLSTLMTTNIAPLITLSNEQNSKKLRTIAGALYYVLPLYLSNGRPNIEFSAQLCGVSSRTLMRRLREEGYTYTGLLDVLIISLAKQYLQNPHYSITEVAFAVGYPYPNHFTRFFKKMEGMTPKQYRKNE